VADLLEAAGVDRAMTVDLHASQIQGFFTKPMDNLYAEDLLTTHMKAHLCVKGNLSENQMVVVSPDAGGAKRASRVAYKLGPDVDCAIISKERLKVTHYDPSFDPASPAKTPTLFIVPSLRSLLTFPIGQ
jgi:ribose-phosphate pyrophosphokinase